MAIRGTRLTQFVNSFVNVTWPAGTLAGDLAIVCAENGYDLSGNPSGWTSQYLATGSACNVLVTSKTLTAADIATGYVTVFFVGNYYGVASVVTWQGSPTIRECVGARSGSYPITVATSSSPAIGNIAIYFGMGRNNATISTSRGTQLWTATSSEQCGCLCVEKLNSAGVVSTNFNVASGGGQAVGSTVIVADTDFFSDALSFSDSVKYSLNVGNQRIVQMTQAIGNSPTTIAVMEQNVTAGNFLVVMTGHPGGDDCAGGTNAIYTDTRSLTFTVRADCENVSGAQSNTCILTAPITSSGPETITRTLVTSNYPCAMWVIEVAGMPNFVIETTSAGTSDNVTTVNSGNATSAKSNLLYVASGADSNANSFDSVSVSNANIANVSPQGIFLAKFVGAGTYTTTFGKSAGGNRSSSAAVIISTPAFLADVSDSILLSDAMTSLIVNSSPASFLIGDLLSLSDLLVANFTFPLPPEFGTLHEFEFYGMDTPEDVEILPVPKKYDQVGPIRFDKIGKIFGFRVRLIASGITQTMPYKIYGDDSESIDHLNSPLFFDSFTVRPGLDNVYEIQLPKSVNTDIFRMTFGPVDDPFYRYDVLIKVHISGMKGQAKWIPIR